jgi:hypothetical protein
MNKFINALLLFILLPTMAFSVVVGFDLPLEFLRTTGGQIAYKFEIFLGFGLLLLIINVRRSVRRWMGMRIVNQTNKFLWNQPVSLERKKRVYVYTILEAFVMLCVGSALYYVTSSAILPAIAFWYATADNLIFLLVGSRKNRFRAGITKKAVVVADRDVSVLYFSGLRKVSIHQDTIYFDYIKTLQLYFPLDCIEKEERDSFFSTLEAQLDPNKVFVTRQRN